MIKNNLLKIVSVIIAVGIWVTVVSSQVQTVVISVPVKIYNVPKNYVAVPSQKSVSVTIKGPAKLIQNMPYTSVLLDIDVAAFPVGDSSRRVLPDDFRTPLGLEVIEVEPHSIIITVDQLSTKSVRVVPTFIGDVKKGFIVESAVANPKEVIIEGAKSKLRAIDSIATLPVSLSELDSSSVLSIGFKAEDGVTAVKPENIEVRLKLRPDLATVTLKAIPVACEGLDAKLTMKAMPVLQSVKIEARRDIADSFADSSRFIVDCSQIKASGRYSGIVGYQTTLEDVEVLSITPQKINFEIVKK